MISGASRDTEDYCNDHHRNNKHIIVIVIIFHNVAISLINSKPLNISVIPGVLYSNDLILSLIQETHVESEKNNSSSTVESKPRDRPRGPVQ